MQTKIEVLQHMIKQLRRYTILDSVNIPIWTAAFGRHTGKGHFEVYDRPEQTLRLGGQWTTSYDETAWFRADVTVPERYTGCKTYLEIDFGGEAIVRINGTIAGAVSSNMNAGWVHRDRIFLPDPLPEDRVLHIEIEATVNSGGFCDTVLAGGNSETYTLSKARIVRVDEAAESYLFDVLIVDEAIPLIKDPAISARVRAALDASLHRIDFDFDEAVVRASFAPAAEILWERIGKIGWTPQSTVIMTGHSHIDIAWLWTVRECYRKCARTFSNNLALMERYPDFIFAQSQAALYDMTKTSYPDVYEGIKAAVARGQWDILGNAWAEADTNVASGESLARQLLYGREFFMREFGVSSDVYWLPDCFGFTWALPQIIRRSGMKYFLTAKLGGQDINRFPHTIFRWRGNDGSEVVAYMQRVPYGDEYETRKIVNAWDGNDEKGITDTVMGMFGYGDGGGGATFQMIENGRRIQKLPGIPGSRIGHASEFFRAAGEHEDELPVWDDEMYYENHRGTYTSQGFVKMFNRRGEFLLPRAEMAGCFAHGSASGLTPDAGLFVAWKLLLVNQFHDILPGTSIHEVYDICRSEYAEMMEIGERILHRNLRAVAAQVGCDGASVICFNLLSAPYRGIVRAAISEGVPADETGKPYPFTETVLNGTRYVSFEIPEIPPMGYKTCPVVHTKQCEAALVYAGDYQLENEFLKVRFAPSGELLSVYDKENRRETLEGCGNTLRIYQDKPKHESAWNLEANYVKKSWDLAAESCEVAEASALCGAYRFRYRFNRSTITQEVRLYRNSRRLDFVTTADWYETEKLLRTSFDVAVKCGFATYEIAHGAICRPTHNNTSYDIAKFEVCAHKWSDLSEGGYGVSLLNDCKYGCDVHGSRMSVSLLRAPNCPDRTGDHGEHRFTYSYYPHCGSWQDGGTVAEAFALNQQPYAFAIAPGAGTSPATHSYVSTDFKSIVIDTLKPAQNGDGLILRMYESESRRGDVTVRLGLAFDSVTECNLMEVDETPLQSDGDTFTFSVKPFEVRTFRIR